MAFMRYHADEDDWPDEADDADDDVHDSDDEEPGEVPCPVCGESVIEDTPRCPHCGEWIDAQTTAERRSRGWLWPILVAGLVLMILVMWARMGL